MPPTRPAPLRVGVWQHARAASRRKAKIGILYSMNLAQARSLMQEWTPSPALRVHMEAVGACMGAYAKSVAPADAERWAIAGILHDFDYEKHPTQHPVLGVDHLKSLGVDDEIREAILGHTGHAERVSPMARTLFAVDELAGFIVACAKVRPNGISDLEPKSVKKKLKDKAFAAAVSREDIANGIAALGMDETAHIQTCIDAIRAESARLGV